MEKKRILVVDDEPNLIRLIRVNLQRAGFAVDTAENGIAAWKLLQENKYDGVICDTAMPEMNGYQLLRRVQNECRFEQLPFVLLTARAPDLNEYALLDYVKYKCEIAKPFNPAELVQLINGLTKTAQNDDAA